MVTSVRTLLERKHHENLDRGHYDCGNRDDHRHPHPGRSGSRDANLIHVRHRRHPHSAHWSARWILCQPSIPTECGTEWKERAVKPAEKTARLEGYKASASAFLRAVFFA